MLFLRNINFYDIYNSYLDTYLTSRDKDGCIYWEGSSYKHSPLFTNKNFNIFLRTELHNTKVELGILDPSLRGKCSMQQGKICVQVASFVSLFVLMNKSITPSLSSHYVSVVCWDKSSGSRWTAPGAAKIAASWSAVQIWTRNFLRRRHR